MASRPVLGFRDASVADPLSDLWFDTGAADENLRDAGMARHGRIFWARLGTKKSSTGGRCAARYLELCARAAKDIVNFRYSLLIMSGRCRV
jgi:hypothetical protein